MNMLTSVHTQILKRIFNHTAFLLGMTLLFTHHFHFVVFKMTNPNAMLKMCENFNGYSSSRYRYLDQFVWILSQAKYPVFCGSRKNSHIWNEYCCKFVLLWVPTEWIKFQIYDANQSYNIVIADYCFLWLWGSSTLWNP